MYHCRLCPSSLDFINSENMTENSFINHNLIRWIRIVCPIMSLRDTVPENQAILKKFWKWCRQFLLVMQYIGLHNVNFGIPKDFGHIPKILEIMRLWKIAKFAKFLCSSKLFGHFYLYMTQLGNFFWVSINFHIENYDLTKYWNFKYLNGPTSTW